VGHLSPSARPRQGQAPPRHDRRRGSNPRERISMPSSSSSSSSSEDEDAVGASESTAHAQAPDEKERKRQRKDKKEKKERKERKHKKEKREKKEKKEKKEKHKHKDKKAKRGGDDPAALAAALAMVEASMQPIAESDYFLKTKEFQQWCASSTSTRTPMHPLCTTHCLLTVYAT
jgi:outer membrane biosynthesis protein TonB